MGKLFVWACFIRSFKKTRTNQRLNFIIYKSDKIKKHSFAGGYGGPSGKTMQLDKWQGKFDYTGFYSAREYLFKSVSELIQLKNKSVLFYPVKKNAKIPENICESFPNTGGTSGIAPLTAGYKTAVRFTP